MAVILNLAPIRFEDQPIDIEEFRYSEKRFDQLQKDHRRTHFIKRTEERIIAVPLRKSAPIVGGRKRNLLLSENLGIVSSLVTEALYRHLRERSCWVTGIKPLSYLVLGRNLLTDCLPHGVATGNGLGVYARWELEVRIINPNDDGTYPALSINVGTAPRINYTCKTLIDARVPLTGYYVGRGKLGRYQELKPKFMSVGKVVGITGELLELDDLRPGEDSPLLANHLYLEPREDVLEHCIRHLYGLEATNILDKLAKKIASFHTGPEKLNRLRSALQSFQDLPLELVEGVPFCIDSFLSDDETLERTGMAEKPTFVFAYGGQKVSPYNDIGLQKYGPYSREGFSPSRPRICVICQASKKGQVEQVVKKFLDGIPPVEYAKGKNYEYTGLKAKYHLLGCQVEFFTTVDDSVEAYNRATSEALRIQGQETWSLALDKLTKPFVVERIVPIPT